MEAPPAFTPEIVSLLLRDLAIVPVYAGIGFLLQGTYTRSFADVFGRGNRKIWLVWFGSCSAVLLAASFIVRLHALHS